MSRLLRRCIALVCAAFGLSAGPAKADSIDACLSQREQVLLGFDAADQRVVFTRDGARQEVQVGQQSLRLPPQREVPLTRYFTGLDGVLALSDDSGNERFTLSYYPFSGAAPKQLSPPGSRIAAPFLAPAPRTVVFTSTASTGPLWGLLAHDLSSDVPQVLFQEGGAWQGMAASADGRRLLMQQVFGLYDRVLYLFDRVSKLKVPLYLGRRPVAVRDAVLSPDGERVYAAVELLKGGAALLQVDVPTSKVSVLHRADWPLYDLAISADGGVLAALENRGGRSTLLRFSLSDAAAPAEVTLGGWAAGLTLNSDGAIAGLTRSAPGVPRHVLTVSTTAAPLPASCVPSTFVSVQIGRPGPVAGVKTLPVFTIFPVTTVPEPLPVILAFHGGPEAQWTAQSHLEYIALAETLGAAVVMPNLVGSTGHGLLYSAADDGLKRKVILDDVTLLLEWIAQNPRLDSGRVIADGASYGGYLSLLTAARFPDQVVGAVSKVGITHLPRFLSQTPVTRRSLRRAEYGDERQAKIMKALDALSPETLAADITAPILLIHGANDARVPAAQSRDLAQTLEALGKRVDYVELPSEGHLIRDPETRLRLARRKADFMADLFATP